MGNLGLTEILLIGIALLIFFGPSRLPELGKSLGKGIQEFKKASRDLTDSVKL
jgi:sec-independent protein translocase protein TatA